MGAGAHACLRSLEKSEQAPGRRQRLAGDSLNREGLVRGQQGRILGQQINTSQGRVRNEHSMFTA